MNLTYNVAFGETASGELGTVGIIQDKKTGKWLDWPEVEAALRAGHKVHIRPLTEKEILKADRKLDKLYRKEMMRRR